jgi:hypothetical protein
MPYAPSGSNRSRGKEEISVLLLRENTAGIKVIINLIILK